MKNRWGQAEEIELAYSPQFGLAEDSINMAGFVAARKPRAEPHTRIY